MSKRVGIVGISGYGGGEALRLIAQHPEFQLVYAAGESSAGSPLSSRFPSLDPKLGSIIIEKFDPTKLPDLDLLIASLPTDQSRQPLADVSKQTKIVDIGGDHRYKSGWQYGLADIWPERIKNQSRVANPGCYPSAALSAIAPLLEAELISSENIIIDAKSGISGAGRGGADNKFGFAECNEDVAAYGLLKHTHMPEISETIKAFAGKETGLVFTPHLIPMTRGVLATIYARGSATTEACTKAARAFYRDRYFVRIVDQPPHTKWALGSNHVFIHYACDPIRKLVMAVAAIDNLGKGAAGQAVQNANLMFDLPETMGLTNVSLWP